MAPPGAGRGPAGAGNPNGRPRAAALSSGPSERRAGAAAGAAPLAVAAPAPPARAPGAAGGPDLRAAAPAEAAAHAGPGALVAVCLPPFVSLLSTLALSPFLPFIAADLDASVTLLGQVPALMMLAAGLFGLVVGPVADRVGLRATLVFGLAAAVAGALGTALATSVAVLLVVAFVTALARAIGQPLAQAVVGAHFAGAARRRAMSAVQATTSLSPIAGVPLLALVGEWAGWRMAFVALALISLATVPVTLALLPRDERRSAGSRPSGGGAGGPPPGPSSTPAPRAPSSAGRPAAPPSAGRGGVGPSPAGGLLTSTLASFGPLLRDAPTLGLFGSTFFRNVGQWAILTYLGAFLVHQYGLSAPEVGLAFTATGVGSIVGSLATGGPLGRLPLRSLAIWANVFVLTLAGLTFLLPFGAALSVGLVGVSFMANGAVLVATNTLLVSESRGGRATTTSLNGTAMSLGGAIGSSLGGVLLWLGGYPAIGLLALGCALVTPLCIVAGRR